ncbi:MAG: AAA family ATPase [Bacteroidales bacterium]|uniref:AAA family ATPase n=1 Tax=Porphyromonas sp. TaxID=1924944 RepID=UPI00297244D4|nr:AAA family ATPase [Porphyromonas sp.]MDD7438342.1 AAA family ATPase [Bacteroidales bacterium]MDY3066768.1 AAA family ATPase [Porphyromonas sp.]
MPTITIRNFGPIKDVTIPIKKYNIFIGSSGTGKSTLSKVICNAQWLEKELVVSKERRPNQENIDWYVKQLSNYHNLNKYIQTDSYIQYSGDFLSFVFDNANSYERFSYEIKRNLLDFRRRKTLYVPAERSMVSVIPNWFEIKLPQNNLRGFLSSWEDARMFFTKENPLLLSLFNAKYFTSDNGALDIISFFDGKEMLLGEVASGVQASVPLLLLIKYYSSPERVMRLTSISERLDFSDLIDCMEASADNLEPASTGNEGGGEFSWNFGPVMLHFKGKEAEFYKAQLQNLITIRGTSFFIEEPELNLFPQLQYQLFSEIVREINKEKDNALTITTHSPYILAFISNYIYAHHLQNSMNIDVQDILPTELMIDTKDVSAYLLVDGTASSLLTDPAFGIEIKDLDVVSEEVNTIWEKLLDRELKQ